MDGRAVSAQLMPELRRHAGELSSRHGVSPGLAAVLVGNDPASRQYVRNKQRYSAELGFTSRLIEVPVKEATTAHLLEVIEGLNGDSAIAGILIQLPLPQDVDEFALFDAIDPLKDVDGVARTSVAGFYRAQWGNFIPCTPRGVLTLLSYYQVPVDGACAAVIGRSDIAGKPLALILGGRMCNATVTWCHRHTRNLEEICRQSDLLVTCVGADAGRPFFITADMVKPGACVIDVGFRRVGPGRFAGDVDFEGVKETAGWVTLNPGGTGPMTVLALMQNLIDAARYQLGLERARYTIE
ncbi:MAG TPA: bifunctional 5,10-methylenetetrahydrofolate dehydrogenase/5,10-methenyltetrahydrofolate cyclohydrolase [Candidatus Binataceae bacterium]|jgi:methylenetetrahydrofolate dehydrogenase (NADP+)/methenyltetrahydrofolate cyclohydrolase|nr:bifunctional 5,10-methylenetetrahydrofolate dehydrogenase/5,10-methenyltetrahydrofolate cyclohydrolase [Candidatus Binataceae bacterium]